MALETKPAWMLELKKQLEQPYTPEELERIRLSFETVDRLNAGKTWPPGTYERLLEMARAEDSVDDEARGEEPFATQARRSRRFTGGEMVHLG